MTIELAQVKRVTAANTAALLPDPLPYPVSANLDEILINNLFVSEDLQGAIFDGEILESMAGASTITLNVIDRDRSLIHGGLLANWVNANDPTIVTTVNGQRRHIVVPSTWHEIYLTLEGRDYALVQVNKMQDEFDLVFENRAVHEMRKIIKAMSWARTTYTRAQVIKYMCDEVTNYDISFYAKELHTVQPITSLAQRLTTAQKQKLKLHGFAPNANIKVKGVKATPQQVNYLSRVLAVGESQNSLFPVLIAGIETVTQESGVGSDTNNTMNGGPSNAPVGLFQQIKDDGWPATGSDIEKDAAAFFSKANAYYEANPNATPDQIALAIQAPGGSSHQYGQWETEARTTLRLYGTPEGGSVSYTDIQPYFFTRGKAGVRENSWDCGIRLAQEVVSRLFMVDNTCYYMSDDDLVNQIPLDTISETQDGIDTIDYEVDTGKKVSQCTVKAHINRWRCPPGSVVVLEDSGPVNGRWLVWEVRRPLFSPIAEITLQIPSPPKPEPAPATKSVSLGANSTGAQSGNAGVDAVYQKAIAISKLNYPYVWGGGHVTVGVPSQGAPAGLLGFDCSGYVSACLAAAGWLTSPLTSTGLMTWGAAGRGEVTVWSNKDHTFITFEFTDKNSGAAVLARADTVPNDGTSPNGPSGHGWVHIWDLNIPEDLTQFTPRYWPGTQNKGLIPAPAPSVPAKANQNKKATTANPNPTQQQISSGAGQASSPFSPGPTGIPT